MVTDLSSSQLPKSRQCRVAANQHQGKREEEKKSEKREKKGQGLTHRG